MTKTQSERERLLRVCRAIGVNPANFEFRYPLACNAIGVNPEKFELKVREVFHRLGLKDRKGDVRHDLLLHMEPFLRNNTVSIIKDSKKPITLNFLEGIGIFGDRVSSAIRHYRKKGTDPISMTDKDIFLLSHQGGDCLGDLKNTGPKPQKDIAYALAISEGIRGEITAENTKEIRGADSTGAVDCVAKLGHGQFEAGFMQAASEILRHCQSLKRAAVTQEVIAGHSASAPRGVADFIDPLIRLAEDQVRTGHNEALDFFSDLVEAAKAPGFRRHIKALLTTLNGQC